MSFTSSSYYQPRFEALEGLRISPSEVIRCFFLIFRVRMSLKLRGYARTLEWIKAAARARGQSRESGFSHVAATERLVATAGALYPGRSRCLEQSLTLYLILRRQSVPVEFCQGVQPHPFAAHAWIEYQGAVVNDVAEHVDWFTPLPGILP